MNSLSSGVLALVYAVFAAAEFWLGRAAHRTGFGFGNAVVNVSLGLLSAASDLVMMAVFLVFYEKMGAFALFPIAYSWQYWVVLFLGHDLLYWVMHLCEHKIRLLWAVHFTHHSSREMNLTVAIRSSVWQPVYRYLFYLPLVVIGFHGKDVFFMWLVANTWVSYVHTEAVGRLGILEKFLVTPAVHRVHHSSRPEHLDKNFGIVLSIWDRLFGTFSIENPVDTARPYGLTTQTGDFNFAESLTYEWKKLARAAAAAPGLMGKILVVFGPPKG